MGAPLNHTLISRAERLKASSRPLDDLTPLQRLTVLYTRLWLSGPDAQATVWNDLASRYGPAKGSAALAAFEGFLRCVADNTARKLTRRPARCPRVSYDEEALAGLVLAATADSLVEAKRWSDQFLKPGTLFDVAAAAAAFGRLMIDAETEAFGAAQRIH